MIPVKRVVRFVRFNPEKNFEKGNGQNFNANYDRAKPVNYLHITPFLPFDAFSGNCGSRMSLSAQYSLCAGMISSTVLGFGHGTQLQPFLPVQDHPVLE
jgi:hypothetical protein